jgi:apolipoprotein N-acyltransferase
VTLLFIGLLALSWTGLSLAVLAMVLRRVGTARQAAWRAFGIGLVVNTISAWYAAPGEPVSTVILIVLCHLLLLPALLIAARREEMR